MLKLTLLWTVSAESSRIRRLPAVACTAVHLQGSSDARVAVPAVSRSLPQQWRQVVSPPPPTFMVMRFWAQSFLFAPDVKI
ncbi:unnamed protein product [Rangifer tarandus platyrhynchus]|uniref:Uncharacterized protein n=1 Tax=Rangifer tarandus platyrhynchus TaxID=3082113 RepID=A0AC59ZFQ1_RANTA